MNNKNIIGKDNKIKKSVKKSRKDTSPIKIVIGYEDQKNLKTTSSKPKEKKKKKTFKEKLNLNDTKMKKIYITLFFLMMFFILIFLVTQMSKIK